MTPVSDIPGELKDGKVPLELPVVTHVDNDHTHGVLSLLEGKDCPLCSADISFSGGYQGYGLAGRRQHRDEATGGRHWGACSAVKQGTRFRSRSEPWHGLSEFWRAEAKAG